MAWVERMQRIVSSASHEEKLCGEILYLNSPHSQTLLRVYDKSLGMQFMEREGWWSMVLG
jgi:hypothetical protein